MPKRKTGHKLLAVRMSSEQHKNLTADADEQAESVSTVVRAAIRTWLDNTDFTVKPEDRLPQ